MVEHPELEGTHRDHWIQLCWVAGWWQLQLDRVSGGDMVLKGPARRTGSQGHCSGCEGRAGKVFSLQQWETVERRSADWLLKPSRYFISMRIRALLKIWLGAWLPLALSLIDGEKHLQKRFISQVCWLSLCHAWFLLGQDQRAVRHPPHLCFSQLWCESSPLPLYLCLSNGNTCSASHPPSISFDSLNYKIFRLQTSTD